MANVEHIDEQLYTILKTSQPHRAHWSAAQPPDYFTLSKLSTELDLSAAGLLPAPLDMPNPSRLAILRITVQAEFWHSWKQNDHAWHGNVVRSSHRSIAIYHIPAHLAGWAFSGAASASLLLRFDMAYRSFSASCFASCLLTSRFTEARPRQHAMARGACTASASSVEASSGPFTPSACASSFLQHQQLSFTRRKETLLPWACST